MMNINLLLIIFLKILKEFINQHGLYPNMNVETAVNEIISSIPVDSPPARLQALFKRKQQQDAIIPELIVKQDEERKQDTINTLSNVFKRKKQQEGIIPELKAKQDEERLIQGINAARKQNAARNIQRILEERKVELKLVKQQIRKAYKKNETFMIMLILNY